MSNRDAGLGIGGRFAERGFTLIEMMVALAVFSLAALALLKLEGATVSSTHELDRRTMAQVVARNLAAETLTDPTPPPLGKTDGTEVNGGSRWTWTRGTRRIGDGGATRIDIAVADEAGQELASLTLVRRSQ
jgi:general secretion pathway protein I